MIISQGLYLLVWNYKILKQIKLERNLSKIKPGWRTVGLLIPIYNVWLIYELFAGIRDLGRQEAIEVPWSPGWKTFAYLFGNAALTRWALDNSIVVSGRPVDVHTFFGRLGDLVAALAFYCIALFAIAAVQKTLNQYWAKRRPELSFENNFSLGEWCMMMLGIALWVLELSSAAGR